MDDNSSVGGAQSPAASATQSQTPVSPVVATPAPATAVMGRPIAAFTPAMYDPPRRRVTVRWVLLSLGVAITLLLVIGLFLAMRSNSNAQVSSGEYGPIQVPLGSIASSGALLDSAKTLKVNGQLQISSSLVLTPSDQPAQPLTGQLYFDKNSNQLSVYNGQQFQTLGGPSTTNTTNVIGGTAAAPTGVSLQSTAPGTQQTGNFNISGTGQVGALRTGIVSSGGGALYINPVSISTEPKPEGVPTHIGLDTLGGTTEADPGWQNGLSAQKVTMGDVGGKMSSMSVHYIGGSASNHVQFGLYEDDGDVPSKPGARVAASAIVNLVPDGWTTASLPAVTLSPNTTYWLVVNTDDATVRRTQNGGSQNYCYVFKPFGSMPDPFSLPGCFGGDLTYPLYATFLTSGGEAGTVSQAHISIDTDGATLLRNSEDSNNAFQVQNATGTNTIFNVDTINGRVAIGKANASYKLDIAGGDVNLSNGRSLRFGGLQTLTTTSSGVTALSSLAPGGGVRIQGDTFSVQDRAATHTNLAINNVTGAVVFSNLSDSANAFQIQNATGSTTILNVDSTTATVTVRSLVVSLSLTLNGHLITGGTTPGIAAGAAACTTPTVAVSGTDTSGTITVTTGTGCASAGTLATVTFASAFGAKPHVTLTPGSSTAMNLGGYVDNGPTSTTQFVLATNSTASDATTYQWNYMAVQ